MKAINKISYILFILPFLLCGCNQEDDIYEIFTTDTWHWNASYTTTNWEDDNNAKLHIDLTNEKVYDINMDPNIYIIKFEEDGTFAAKGSNISFTGMWSADPKDHSFGISSVKLQGNPSGLDKMFYDEIRTAEFYRGSSILLKLFNSAKNEFIQLHPQSKIKQ